MVVRATNLDAMSQKSFSLFDAGTFLDPILSLKGREKENEATQYADGLCKAAICAIRRMQSGWGSINVGQH